jgi:hypothetical protein
LMPYGRIVAEYDTDGDVSLPPPPKYRQRMRDEKRGGSTAKTP